ncbi:SDR family NAD(P)-dependent oxidoreductase [Planctomicrobium sp. SH668]|uniref:SDR family NAD(P)-dependent oxidoreductase n=1 Tax=Planctomicrobium sp. SH668 TaxID=3448126 RepID=UPI003F5B0DBE
MSAKFANSGHSIESSHPIALAIVGMDCCLPGASNLAEFETLLFAGKRGFSHLPEGKLERELYFDERRGQPGKTYTTLGGIVPDRVLRLQQWGMSAKEIASIDVVHQRFCDVALSAWESAGLRGGDSRWRKTGVFVGHSGATQNGGKLNLASLIEEGLDFLNDQAEIQKIPAGVRAEMLHRVASKIRSSRPRRDEIQNPRYQAYTAASLPATLLGFDGPRIVCDAACASSLFAMQQAIHAIRHGRIEAAIVGGATTNGVDNLILFSQSQACSDRGSYPFDQDASGLISSEGYAAVVIVPLETARELKLPIRGVIEGLGTSSDGRGKSLWAPRAEGQQLAIRRAYPDDHPLQIDYLEAHATSTQLGDATELQAVNGILQSIDAGVNGEPLLIGSLKSNLGHTLETAGVAGLVKILLAMKRGEIPETVGYTSPNTGFDWSSKSIQVVNKRRPWKPKTDVRRAAVSAFGIGGLNAHLYVREPGNGTGSSVERRLPLSHLDEPIAIVGRGAVLPGAHHLEQFRQLLRSKTSAIGPAPADRWRNQIGVKSSSQPAPFQTPTCLGGFIHDYEFDSQKYRIPPKQVRQANPLQMMLLDAVSQAIHEVDQGLWNFNRQKTGVVIGTIFSGDFGSQLQLGLRLPEISKAIRSELLGWGLSSDQAEKILTKYREDVLANRPALLDETGSFTASTLASRVAKTFDLMGGACAIDVDDASGLAALNHALDQLRSGVWDVAVCGAAERAMDLAKFEQLDRKGALLRTNNPSDINDQSNRLLPGEGAVVFILERLSVARERGHSVLGVIDGVHCDMRQVSVDQDDQSQRKFDRSLVRQIGYLTGAQTCVELLKQTILWEENPDVPQLPQISCQAEDGLHYQLDYRTASQPEKQDLKQTLNQMAPTSSQSDSKPDVHSPQADQMSLETAPPQDNPHLIRTEYKYSMAPTDSQDVLVRLAGANTQRLIEQIDLALQRPDQAMMNRSSVFASGTPSRLAVIASSPEQLKTRLVAARKRLSEGRLRGVFETDRTILWQAKDRASRTAWVFPGQGSYYVEGPALLEKGQTASEVLNAFDAEIGSIGLSPLSALLKSPQTFSADDIWMNQLWVLGCSLALTAELKARGWSPDVVLGHSFGEYAALVACGVLTMSQVVRMVKSRSDAVCLTVREPGRLISVRATPSEVSSAIRRTGIAATITHMNAPQQTLVATEVALVETLRKELTNSGFASVVIPVPVAYHTPRMADAAEILRSCYSKECFLPPKYGFLSTTSSRYLAEPDDLRHSLVSQMNNSVIYAPAIQRLVGDNVDLIIEVGPNQILSRMNQEICGSETLSLSLDVPGRSVEERLLLLQAATEIVGASPASTRIVGTATNVSPGAALTQSKKAEVEIIDFRRAGLKRESNDVRQELTFGQRAAVEQSFPSQVDESNWIEPPVVRTPDAESPPVQSLPIPSSSGSGVQIEEIREFLMTVVIDLTGYSPDVVDFDADLEADLGIDSIKKAQIIGELAVVFELSVAPNDMSMGELRTLSQIAEVAARLGKTQQAVISPKLPVEQSLESDVSDPTILQGHITGSEAVFDAVGAERFLIDLVVDQTGYAPDVVDLDAELEADLGIDSIKQAQLLGEVQLQFSLPVSAIQGRTLSSFTTLRKILEFLKETVDGSSDRTVEGNGQQNHPASPLEENEPLKKNGPFHRETRLDESEAAQFDRNVEAPNGVEEVRGVDLGDEISEQISRLFLCSSTGNVGEGRNAGRQRGIENKKTVRHALRLLIDMKAAEESSSKLSDTVVAELTGLAEGAGVSLPSVLRAHRIFNSTSVNGASGKTARGVSVLSKPLSIATVEEKNGPQLHPDQSMRFAMRIAEASQREGISLEPKFSGPALVVGNNQVARAIQQQFQQQGLDCFLVPDVSSLEELDRALSGVWARALTPHLFITTSHDESSLRDINVAAWKRRRFAAVEVPYRVCQLWMQRMIDDGKMDGASVVAVMNLGGDFGFSGQTCESPEGGLGGLIKAMLIEAWMRGFRATPMKVIDVAPGTSSRQIVQGIWRELAVPSYDMEVAIHGDQRYAVQPVYLPLTSSLEPHPTGGNGHSRVRSGGTWVVTGGARGITSVVVRELAKRHDLKLHLLGTAPVPKISDELRVQADCDRLQLRRWVMAEAARKKQNGMEAWRNIEKGLEIDATIRLCKSEGIQATYHCCDVSNFEQVQQTLTVIRRTHGAISGVIHGAGIGQDARFDRKRPDKVDQCLRAKIDGCINLMDATRQDALEWFVAFGSISGRFGANGHTDYSFANDSLAKLVGRYRRERPEVFSVTFHWHAWGDIGMATKPETKLALEMIQLEFMPAQEGIAHFLNELELGGDEPEVLITDRAYYRKFFPVDRNVLDGSNEFKTLTSYPILDPEQDLNSNHTESFAVELNPEKERFLNQHLVQGKPTLPFVVAIEMMAEAARATTGKPLVVEARNVTAIQAIKWSSLSPMTVKVQVTPTDSGIDCELVADVRRRDGRIVTKDKTYFEGRFLPAEIVPRSTASIPDLSTLDFEPIAYLDETAVIFHGPDLQCLLSIAIEGDQAYGRISASSTVQLGGGSRPTFGWSINCAAMDACLYAAAVFAGRKYGRASLPVKFEKILFGRLPDPGEICLVTIQLVHQDQDGLILNFQLHGQNDEILLDVRGYRIGWLL